MDFLSGMWRVGVTIWNRGQANRAPKPKTADRVPLISIQSKWTCQGQARL